MTFMGTGTSQGIPMIACNCGVCRSTDPRDKRLRASVLVEYDGVKLLIDAGPDFRYQMLRAGVGKLDAILLTHNQKDHTGGLDDVRALNYFYKKDFPIYCEPYVQESLKREYAYAFAEEKYPGVPQYVLETIGEEPFEVCGVKVVPIRALHYKLPILGFRIGNMAYLTDASYIDESQYEKLQGLDIFVINSIRYTEHISHFSVPEALEVIKRVGAKRSYFTHLSHQLPVHSRFAAMLPEGCAPAYDTLTLDFD